MDVAWDVRRQVIVEAAELAYHQGPDLGPFECLGCFQPAAICPRCGAELGSAFIEQLAAPQVARVRLELEQDFAAREKAMENDVLTRVRAGMRNEVNRLRNQAQRSSETAATEKQRAQAATVALAEAQEQLEQMQAEQSRMRDQIARSERKRAQQEAERKYRPVILEYQNREKRALDQLALAESKISPGPPPQPTGVAYQHAFAEELQRRYPEDEISVIRNGQKGGDVLQIVRVDGRSWGSILWECKRTKHFSSAWIPKLVRDVDRDHAGLGVLVSASMPATVDGVAIRDGILLCAADLATYMSIPLRQAVIDNKRHAIAGKARRGRADRLLEYVDRGGFFAHLQRIVQDARETLATGAKLRNQVHAALAKLDQHQQDVLDRMFTMFGELDAAGVAVPPALHSEHVTDHRSASPNGARKEGPSTRHPTSTASRTRN
ncbi:MULTISPECIES: DUF2130 domain-containing protein [Nocardia]|uniref:DUF2130 domain-containing protein n=4 Tax=Nocardia TaxID=1817 RepID=A0A7G1KIY7_9NOCA|nr:MULTISPECIES: DUF2130 domain-containing protein [Nocardia]MBF6259825.1 DUF2130 domain-containing protein [Nocardia farcinica]MBF6295401.1 DUF2130 domain-containing protein [Nocardia farcinica]MBF6362297.1 DUF2130 domain-containing protein [Nocardia farcinica]MBF6381940.1 DUF2130 domain-containing protein [Nocardia farcinica]MBF6386168.1 DUF2130 domain-containing protein [Nocardia farcinica]